MRAKYMRRIVCILTLVSLMSPFSVGSDKKKGTEMSGTICDQKCVKQDADKASCDTSCTEQSGEATFIDDHGKAWKVANPEVCKGHMGQKVKVQCNKMKDKPDTMEILSIFG